MGKVIEEGGRVKRNRSEEEEEIRKGSEEGGKGEEGVIAEGGRVKRNGSEEEGVVRKVRKEKRAKRKRRGWERTEEGQGAGEEKEKGRREERNRGRMKE